MPRVAIVVDSSAGVAPEYCTQHSNVRIVPLLIQMQGQTLRDGIDITEARFYELLPECSPLPTTSQTPMGDLVRMYSSLADAGYEGIVSLHLSSGISSACASAQVAAGEVSIPVEVVDTLCTSSGSLYALEAAVRASERGSALQDVAQAARAVVASERTIFAVDTLDYLRKGGRISASAAMVGSVLQFKPLLCFADGKITALEKVRTSSRALRRLVEVMVDWVGADTPVLARVVHGGAPESAQQLMELAQSALNVTEMRFGWVPPVIGAHTGPGIVSLCCVPVAAAGL